jgi:O-antigen biosynthesis protein WbqP
MLKIILKLIFFFGFIIVTPIILIAMIAIFLEDRFPLIFIQKRYGKNRKIFYIYKLRTMKKNTPNMGTHDVGKDNFLKCGFFLRKLKIDELPQILNYLYGDISLIGPRPSLPSQKELEAHRLANNIFNIKPGITGLSQVLGYDMSNPKRLSEVDKLYLDKKSLKLDLLIFLATFLKFIKIKIAKMFEDDLKRIGKNV